MINPAMIFRLKSSWEKFTASHPKFPMFLQAAVNNNVLREGTILEINITTLEGQNISTNLKINPEDLELIEDLKNMTDNCLVIFFYFLLQAFIFRKCRVGSGIFMSLC